MSVLTALRRWWLTPKTYPNGARFSGAQHVLFGSVVVAAVALLVGSLVAAIRFPSVGTVATAFVLLGCAGWYLFAVDPASPSPGIAAQCPHCRGLVQYEDWEQVDGTTGLMGCPSCHRASKVDDLFPPVEPRSASAEGES